MRGAARIACLGAVYRMTAIVWAHRHLILAHPHWMAAVEGDQMQAEEEADRQSPAAKAILDFSDPLLAKQDQVPRHRSGQMPNMK